MLRGGRNAEVFKIVIHHPCININLLIMACLRSKKSCCKTIRKPKLRGTIAADPIMADPIIDENIRTEGSPLSIFGGSWVRYPIGARQQRDSRPAIGKHR